MNYFKSIKTALRTWNVQLLVVVTLMFSVYAFYAINKLISINQTLHELEEQLDYLKKSQLRYHIDSAALSKPTSEIEGTLVCKNN